MIKSCEDVKTMAEFHRFCSIYFNTIKIGLNETARLVIWNNNTVVDPKTIDDILK
ncbi:hypothetical protein LCGC14_1445680 [marine sediment metagenome]|uniref:Uncharacterized protein n=1 Tax=marine sediment metagenome TaxID=412755 RepID=A0A0F9MLA4_9ZZZZ